MAKSLEHELEYGRRIREGAWKIVEGTHTAAGAFERKDYIALGLFSRCLESHEGIELLLRNSLIDNASVLLRSLIEYAVNCVYMFRIADPQTANDYVDYADYLRFEQYRDMAGTDERLVAEFPREQVEAMRIRYEELRPRFTGRRGDKWCVDDALYKRARRIDAKIKEEIGTDTRACQSLVNTLWRFSSRDTHGTADSISRHLSESGEAVVIHRKPTKEEAAEVLWGATLALLLALDGVDSRFGKSHYLEIKKMFEVWGGVPLD